MKFTTNTQYLMDALNLGIVNANVSKFYQKSCVVELSATSDTLTINIEASRIATQLFVYGQGDTDSCSPIFVDCLLFKQLIATLDPIDVTLEFAETALVIHSGTSKFSIPKMLEDLDVSMRTPQHISSGTSTIPIDVEAWKFIKDTQMYAMAISLLHPVYTNVWVGEFGDVIVGDFDNSLFTHSKKSNLHKQCLLSDTIINLFTAMPEDAQVTFAGKNCLIDVVTEGYRYICELEPQYEEDEGVGSYNSEIILQLLTRPDGDFAYVNKSIVSRYLGQAELLSTDKDSTIHVICKDGIFTVKDVNVDANVTVECTGNVDFDVELKLSTVKTVFNSYKHNGVYVSPVYTDGELSGLMVWDENVTTVMAVVE